jgi:uncharacterized protein YlxW (UPF0749 family)
MEELSVKEYNQLLDYYKKKVLDLEFNYLLLQIESKRSIDKKNKELDDEIAVYRKAVEDEKFAFVKEAQKQMQKNQLKKKAVEKKK